MNPMLDDIAATGTVQKDGCHLFDNAFIDFFYLDKMLDVGGCIAFDDL